MKTTDQVCAECGKALSDSGDDAGGLCAACALQEALALGDTRPTPTPPRLSQTSSVGRRFGDYQLLDLIGRGGMGVVYKAHQFSLNQEVALKMVLAGREGSAKATRWFRLEAEVAARLRHPNIVRIYHVGEDDGDPFFTMELIEGASMSRRMARGEFTLAPSEQSRGAWHQMQVRFARLMVTLARATHYAHEQGVLHRDIKPGNIIIDKQGEPHLTDFGLARVANAETCFSDSGSIAGTPAYMSPEQARGGRLTTAADTYSLGVILYELLTGRPPFSAATPLETLRLIVEQEPLSPAFAGKARLANSDETPPSGSSRPPSDVELATICLKCIQKNSSARYATARDLADDLERWLRREPIQARPISRIARLQRWIRRNPVGASFIAALVLGMLTTTGLIVRLTNAQDIAQRRADAIRDGIVANIQRLWGSSNQLFEFITSEQLSAFLPEPKPAINYNAPYTRLTIGISVTESPIAQATRFARPLAECEERMTAVLGRRVLLDLKLYKYVSTKVADLVSGDIQFAAMGAFAYVRAKSVQPGLTPVARSDSPKPSVFFARKGSGITNLIQIRGKRVAFGESDATISLWGKVELVRAGIVGADLTSWEHLGSKRAFLDQMQKNGVRAPVKQHFHSHAAAIVAVQLTNADVAVARRDYVQDFTHRQLEIIKGFNSTPQLWVASAALSSTNQAAVSGFRRCWIETKVAEAVNSPTRGATFQIVPVEDSFLDALRSAMTNEVRTFEGSHPVQSIPGVLPTEDDE